MFLHGHGFALSVLSLLVIAFSLVGSPRPVGIRPRLCRPVDPEMERLAAARD
jgi:hypothetical protein